MSKKSLNKLFEAVTPYKYDDPLKRDERNALETIIHVNEKIKILLKCYFDGSPNNRLRVMFSKMDPAKPTFSGSYMPNLNLGSTHAFRLMETIRQIIEEWANKWGNKIKHISFDSIGGPKKTKQLTDLFLKTVKKSSPSSSVTTSRMGSARYDRPGRHGIQINLEDFNRILVSKMLNEHFSTSTYDFNVKDSNPSTINANIIVKPNTVDSGTPKPDIIINLKGSYFPIPNELTVRFSIQSPGTILPYKELNLGANHAHRLMFTIRDIILNWAEENKIDLDSILFSSSGEDKKSVQRTNLYFRHIKKVFPNAKIKKVANKTYSVKLKEFIREIDSKMLIENFNVPVYKDTPIDKDSTVLITNIHITNKIFIRLRAYHFNNDNSLHVIFGIHGSEISSYGELNLGANHAYRLMYTIKELITDWISEYNLNVEQIIFNSSGDEKKAAQRTNLYYKFIKKVFPNAKLNKNLHSGRVKVTLDEFINESFSLLEDMTPYKITKIDHNRDNMLAWIKVNDEISIRMSCRYFSGELSVKFTIESDLPPYISNQYAELNLGAQHAYRLMYTIKKIIMEWISDYNLDVKEINFSSAGDEKKEAQRTNLYYRFIKKVFPNAKLNKNWDGQVKVTLNEFINELDSKMLMEYYSMPSYEYNINNISENFIAAEIKINDNLTILLKAGYNRDYKNLNILFRGTDFDSDVYAELNLGIQHAYRLMFTIKEIIMNWMEEYDIKADTITFSASGTSKKKTQRTNLYFKFIKKVFPNAKVNKRIHDTVVTLNEFINESFPLLEDISSYSYDIDQNDESKYGIEAKIKVNENVKIKMSCFNIGNSLSISFHALNDNNNKYAELNLGVQHAYKLMYTIKEIIVDWISKYNINPIRIEFIPTGFLKKSNQRTNLYYRFIKKVFPNAKITSEPYSAKSTISLNEFINESFPLLEDMTPYPSKTIKKNLYGFSKIITVDENIKIELRCHQYNGSLDLSFSSNASNEYAALNLGAQHAYRLMYTIKKDILEWINEYDIDLNQITFMSFGSPKKENQRTNLYFKFIKKVFPNAKIIQNHYGIVKISLDEFINESFPLLEDMTPYDSDIVRMSRSFLGAEIHVNNSTIIDLMCSEMGDTLMISFSILNADTDKAFDKLNLGAQHAFKLMHTIKKLTIDWMEEYDIKFKKVMFILAGDDKEIRQRTNLYYRFVKKAFPNAKIISNPGSIIPKISLNEFINESFPLLEDMTPYTSNIDQIQKNRIEATIHINKDIDISLRCFFIDEYLYVSFSIKRYYGSDGSYASDYSRLNLGAQHAYRLMYTIKELIMDWVEKYDTDVNKIAFSPSGDYKKAAQRTNLYYRFIKKVFPNAKLNKNLRTGSVSVTLDEFINESFPLLEDMTPYPYEPIIQTVSSTRATIHINKDIDIVLNCYSTMDPMRYKNPVISVDFHIEGNTASFRYGELNLGAQHAHRLMFTIKKIIMDWIEKYDIKADAISFSTSGEGKKSYQRAYLYNRYIKKVFPNAKMSSKGHDHIVSLT